MTQSPAHQDLKCTPASLAGCVSELRVSNNSLSQASIAGLFMQTADQRPDLGDIPEAPSEIFLPRETQTVSNADTVTVMPKVWTGTDFLYAQFPDTVWIVPGMIPEGLSVMGGPPKLGKSRLNMALSVAITTGGVALGCIPIEQSAEVLYLCLEDGEQLFQERLREMAGSNPLANLHVAFEWRRGADGVQDLHAFLREHPGVKLVVVDTLKRFLASTSGRRNVDAYTQAYEEMTPLLQVVREHHIALVVVTHNRKNMVENSDWADDILGSVGLTGNADTILGLFRGSNGVGATLRVRGRRIRKELDLALVGDGHAGWKSLGSADELHMSSQRREIIDALRDSPEPIGPRALASILDTKESRVKQILKPMLQQGQVCRVEDGGKYFLPSKSQST